jgi:hypothetical protein
MHYIIYVRFDDKHWVDTFVGKHLTLEGIICPGNHWHLTEIYCSYIILFALTKVNLPQTLVNFI